jgi:hypothetical protein
MQPMDDMTVTRERRFLSFNLRAVLLFVVVIAVTIGSPMHSAKRQAVTVAKVWKLSCPVC